MTAVLFVLPGVLTRGRSVALRELVGRFTMARVPPTTVQDYIDSISPEHRPLFDRVHRLVLEARPDAEVVLSYAMPTFRVGRRRLHVGVWRHGISLYGWRDEGFGTRHPGMLAAKGTIRLRPEDADDVTDEELRDLARTSLDE